MTHDAMMFIHLSDTHIQAEGQRLWNIVDGYEASFKAIENIQTYGVKPDFFVISGDLVQDGDYEAGYARFRSLLQNLEVEFNVPVLMSLGNHDKREPFQRIILGIENPNPEQRCYYSQIIKNVKVIMLDSLDQGKHDGNLGEEQLAWLNDELAVDRDLPKLLVVHHTPATVVLGGDQVELRDADQLAQVIRGANIIGILTGHIHHPYLGLFAGIPMVSATGIAFTVRHSYVKGKLEVLTGCGYNQVYIRNGAMYVNPVEVPVELVTAAWL